MRKGASGTSARTAKPHSSLPASQRGKVAVRLLELLTAAFTRCLQGEADEAVGIEVIAAVQAQALPELAAGTLRTDNDQAQQHESTHHCAFLALADERNCSRMVTSVAKLTRFGSTHTTWTVPARSGGGGRGGTICGGAGRERTRGLVGATSLWHAQRQTEHTRCLIRCLPHRPPPKHPQRKRTSSSQSMHTPQPWSGRQAMMAFGLKPRSGANIPK